MVGGYVIFGSFLGGGGGGLSPVARVNGDRRAKMAAQGVVGGIRFTGGRR